MEPNSIIKNVVEFLWERPDDGHQDGAYSKMLVTPDTTGSRYFDYRISCYQPKAQVAPHRHRIQEQIYHVLDGEGLMEIDGRRQVVRRHDVVFIAPGSEHALYNTGLTDLTFIVVTSPPVDR